MVYGLGSRKGGGTENFFRTQLLKYVMDYDRLLLLHMLQTSPWGLSLKNVHVWQAQEPTLVPTFAWKAITIGLDSINFLFGSLLETSPDNTSTGRLA